MTNFAQGLVQEIDLQINGLYKMQDICRQRNNIISRVGLSVSPLGPISVLVVLLDL